MSVADRARSRFGSRWDPDTDEVRNPDPYDYPDAKRAHARASRDMTAAAEFRVRAAEEFADARKVYQLALARKIAELRAEGWPATVCQDMARGDETVAELRRKRDIAEGVRDAAEQLAWKASADRRALEQLVDWSMRMAPDGQWGGR